MSAFVLAVATSVSLAEACQCEPARRPCEETWRAAAVFTGKVVAIDIAPPLRVDYDFTVSGQRLVTFEVAEPFRGATSRTLQVRTGRDDASCGYPFEAGKSYVVYARQYPTGQFQTGICTRTRPISDAEFDLAYLRTFGRKPSFAGRVFAEVKFAEATIDGDREPSRPYEGARVTLRDQDGVTRSGVSSRTGAVEIAATVGFHDVSVAVSDGVYATAYPHRVEVKDVRGCAEVNVVVRADGRVSGRVVDADGNAVPHLGVILHTPELPQSSGEWRFESRTDINGDYEFVHVPAGRFVLAVPVERNAEPKDVVTAAESFVVPAGGRVRLDDFTLPAALKYTTLTGVVLGVDGRPAGRARVYLKAVQKDASVVGQTVIADAFGRFSIAVGAGVSYKISASRMTDTSLNQSDEIEVNSETAASPLTLRMKASR